MVKNFLPNNSILASLKAVHGNCLTIAQCTVLCKLIDSLRYFLIISICTLIAHDFQMLFSCFKHDKERITFLIYCYVISYVTS